MNDFYIHVVMLYKSPKSLILLFVLGLLACNDGAVIPAPEQGDDILESQLKFSYNSYRNGNRRFAIVYMDSVFNVFRSKISGNDRFKVYQFMYDSYYGLSEPEMVGLYADSMLMLFDNNTIDKDHYKTEYIKANFSKADWLYDIGKYQDAYKYYYTAKQQAQKDGDSCLLGYYNHKLGLVFYSSSKYRSAIRNFEEALRLLNTCNDFGSFYRQQEINDNIGLCYSNLNRPDSALLYYNRSLSLLKKGYDKFGKDEKLLLDKAIGVVYGNMGSAYFALNNLDTALSYYKNSIAINKQPEHDKTDALYTQIKLADLYLGKGMLQLSRSVLDSAWVVIDSVGNTEALLRWYNVMWKYQKANGQYASALDYLSKSVSLKDSMDKKYLSLQRIELDSRIKGMEHDAQIAQMKKTDESRTRLLLLTFVVALLTAVVSFLLYRNWSVSRKNYESLKNLNTYINTQKEQLKHLLKDLGKAANEKDRILKAVSHDMRSPVNASLALIELIETDKDRLNKEQQDYLQLLRESSNNALSLTKDLLEVATLSSETINKQPTDVGGLVTAVTGLLRFKAAEKQQKIELHVSSEPLICNIDKEKITRVINNLVNNAIKFSPKGATIYVSLEQKNYETELSVKDNGIGIPDNIKDKVFDIFTEAKRFGTSGEQPYGLGLSISKQIVEAHGGRIWLCSEDGIGTTFHVAIP